MPKQAVTDEQGTLSCPPFGMPPIFQPCARLESGLKGEPGLLGPPGQGRQGGIQEDTYRAVVNLHVRTVAPQPGKCLKAWKLTCMGNGIKCPQPDE